MNALSRTAMSCSKPASSAKPALEASCSHVRSTYYRRSNTTRAPRKRTFVNLVMEKQEAAGGAIPLVRCAAAAPEIFDTCCGGGDNNGNNINGGRRNGFGGSSNNGDASFGGCHPAQPYLARALGLAVAIAVLSACPMPASATVIPKAGPTALAQKQATGGKRVESVAEQDKEAGPIYHGQITLSERERRMLARRQLHFKEVIRSERV